MNRSNPWLVSAVLIAAAVWSLPAMSAAQEVRANGGGGPPGDDAGDLDDPADDDDAHFDDTTPPGAVTDLSATATSTTVTLTWTCTPDRNNSMIPLPPGQLPGPPPAVGHHAVPAVPVPTSPQYDIRWSEQEINVLTWSTAHQVVGEPLRVPGTVQSMIITGLSPDTIYSFALKSRDNASLPNWSDMAVVAGATLPDTEGPAAIADLVAWGVTMTSLQLEWIAPADTGGSVVDGYEVRLLAESAGTLTVANWNGTDTIVPGGEPAPHAAGTWESMTVGDLVPGTTYWVAIRSVDGVGNPSSMSVIVVSTVGLPVPDIGGASAGGGCQSSASGTGALLGTVLVLLGSLRRR